MAAKRVSVDAKALYDMIKSYRSDREMCISEYCTTVNEANSERRDFDKGLKKLQIQEIED